jgi:hypothetical protein
MELDDLVNASMQQTDRHFFLADSVQLQRFTFTFMFQVSNKNNKQYMGKNDKNVLHTEAALKLH